MILLMEINIENYGEIRRNFSSSLRKYMPTKRELIDRKTGELKVDKQTLDDLFAAIEEYKTRPTKGTRRNKTGIERGFERALEIDNALTKNGSIAASRFKLSPNEKTKIAAARLFSKNIKDYQVAKDLSAQARSVRDREFYVIKHYIDDQSLDVGKMSDTQVTKLLDGIADGSIDSSGISDSELEKLAYRVGGDQSLVDAITEEPFRKTLLDASEIISRSRSFPPLMANAGQNKGVTMFDER